MRFVLFSDLHVHPWPEFGAEGRLQDCVSVLHDVHAYCKAEGVTTVLFGGDLFHRKGLLYTRPYVAVTRALRDIKDDGITFYAVDGNHDHEDKEGTTHALQPLMTGGLIKGVGRKGWRNVELDGGTVSLFAYCDDKAKLKRRVKEAVAQRDGGLHLALFHHGFKGARVGSALEYEVKEPLDAAKLRLPEHFDFVWSGHYHHHQPIEGCDGRGWYVGSPLEHTRSDLSVDPDAPPKGFIDVSDDGWRIVPLKRPRFLRVMPDDALVAEELEDNFVDMYYDEVNATFEERMNAVRVVARGVKPVPIPNEKTEEQRLDVSPELNPATVLKRYVRYRKKDVRRQELDRGALVRLGRELLRDVEQKEDK